MKTLAVLEMVLKGKRLKSNSQRHYKDSLISLSRFSEDWPKSGVVINEWLATLEAYADTTVQNWYRYVNAAGHYLERVSGKYATGVSKVPNPCVEAAKPKVAKKRRRYFTAFELVTIIKACRFEQDKALVLTLLDSTCRVGELVGLTPRMIGESWIDVQGKTGQRRYRLDSAICDKLREMAGGDDEPVFKNKFGQAANVHSLKQRVRRVIKEAGITGSKLGPHTLRHSGASLVAKETGSALAVKALLQHDDIDTSMEYIHDAEDVLQQRISPLRLVGEQVFKEAGFGVGGAVKQLTMGGDIVDVEASEFDKVEAEVVEGIIDLLDEQFPEIEGGVAVRPLLKAPDLMLIREAFLGYIRSGDAGSKEAEMRYLLRRMLRKVK